MIVYFGETCFEVFYIGLDVGWIMDFPDLNDGTYLESLAFAVSSACRRWRTLRTSSRARAIRSAQQSHVFFLAVFVDVSVSACVPCTDDVVCVSKRRNE